MITYEIIIHSQWGAMPSRHKDIDHLRKNLAYLYGGGRDMKAKVWIKKGRYLGEFVIRNGKPYWDSTSWNSDRQAPLRSIDPKTGKLR